MKIKRVNNLFNIRVREGFVVIGDVHLYNAYPYSTYEDGLISSRLLDLYGILCTAAKFCKAFHLPLIINGDLIHSGVFDYAVEQVLTDFLNKYHDVNIYINTGNHDFDGDVTVLEPLIKYGGNIKHKVFTKPSSLVYNKGKLIMHFIPYEEDVKTVLSLRKINKQIGEGKNVLFIHNTFKGSLFPNKQKIKAGINPNLSKLSKFDLIVASHIHKYQKLGKGRGFYTSSPMPLNFGEKSKGHGYHIVDLKNNIRYFVIPKAPRFIDVDVNETVTTGKLSGNFVRVFSDRPVDKAELKKAYFQFGAKYVTFKNTGKKRLTPTKEEFVKTDNVDSIVKSYSDILSQKYGVDSTDLEQVGLGILNEAKKQLLKDGGKI